MKVETEAYRTERRKRATEPVYLVRFYHVPDYGQAPSYQFSRDFVSRTVLGGTMPQLRCIERMGGGPAQIVPEQGRASIGGFQLDCVDVSGEILRYFANPQLIIRDAMTAAVPAIGDRIYLRLDLDGLPEFGTLEVDTGDNLERIRYSAKDRAAVAVIVKARGVDGTIARDHAAGVRATNGEQIRPGQRVQLLSGYAGMQEAEYMQSQVTEVVDRRISDVVKASYTIETSDITRALRREVFLTATVDTPVILGGHPLVIALRVMLSTGTSTNSQYDILAQENGLGIPYAFLDLQGIEAAIAAMPGEAYCFTITAPEMAKTWLEQEIFKTINAYPLILQDGTLTIRLYTPVLTTTQVTTLDSGSGQAPGEEPTVTPDPGTGPTPTAPPVTPTPGPIVYPPYDLVFISGGLVAGDPNVAETYFPNSPMHNNSYYVPYFDSSMIGRTIQGVGDGIALIMTVDIAGSSGTVSAGVIIQNDFSTDTWVAGSWALV